MSVCADWYACIDLNVKQVHKTLHGTQYIIITMFVWHIFTYIYIYIYIYILYFKEAKNNNSMKTRVVGIDMS